MGWRTAGRIGGTVIGAAVGLIGLLDLAGRVGGVSELQMRWALFVLGLAILLAANVYPVRRLVLSPFLPDNRALKREAKDLATDLRGFLAARRVNDPSRSMVPFAPPDASDREKHEMFMAATTASGQHLDETLALYMRDLQPRVVVLYHRLKAAGYTDRKLDSRYDKVMNTPVIEQIAGIFDQLADQIPSR